MVAPGIDYHRYRQNADGTWSHKPGTTSIKNCDDSGNAIFDPEFADRGIYTSFVGFFKITPWNNMYVESSTASTVSANETSSIMLTDTENALHIVCGMTLSQITALIGDNYTDIGSGSLITEYKLNNGNTLIIYYSKNANGEFTAEHINIINQEENTQ